MNPPQLSRLIPNSETDICIPVPPPLSVLGRNYSATGFPRGILAARVPWICSIAHAQADSTACPEKLTGVESDINGKVFLSH